MFIPDLLKPDAVGSLADQTLTPPAYVYHLSASEIEANSAWLNVYDDFLPILTHEDFATSWVNQSLHDIALSLKEPLLRKKFLDPSISLADLTEVLQYADSERTLRFVSDLISISTRDTSALEYLRDKLDNALHFTRSEQKLVLLSECLSSLEGEKRDQIVAAILRSSNNLSELHYLVTQRGPEQLLKIQGRETTELVAQAVLGMKLRQFNFSSIQSTAELQVQLEAIIQLCTEDTSVRHTQVARDFVETAQDDLRELSLVVQSSPEDLLQVQLQAACAQLEFYYGINISRGQSDNLAWIGEYCENISVFVWNTPPRASSGDPTPNWTLQNIAQIKEVLASVPEGHLLFSKMLRQIELVDQLGVGVLGARYHRDGKIKISTLAIDHTNLSQAYEGISSLVIVLAHEIGHGVQIGAGPAGIDFENGVQPTFQGGESRYDFDEWLSLSGWEVIARERYQATDSPYRILLDGQLLDLYTPVQHKGRRVVLLFDAARNVLMRYDADAHFSSREYSRTSPWEDFAEAFAEYLFLPDRLKRDAPQKYEHLEREFRRYEATVGRRG